MPSQKCLLYAVSGSQKPYIYDLPHVLSLPEGFEFRFRYRHLWISKDVRRAIVGGNDLNGVPLLLLYHSQDTRRLLPLRHATVVRAELIGPMVHVRFRVGPFVAIPREADKASGAQAQSGDPSPSSEAADFLTLKALEITGLRATAGESDKKVDLAESLPPSTYFGFVGGTGALESAKEADHLAWATAAALLANEPGLQGVPIFFLLGFTSAPDDARVQIVKLEKPFLAPASDVRGFSLVEGTRYRFRVLQICEPQSGKKYPAFRVKCDFRGDALEVEGASNLVVGRYDVLEYSFMAKAPGYTELAVSAEPVKFEPSQRAGDKDAAQVDPAKTPAVLAGAPESHAADKESPALAGAWPAVFSARVPVSVRRRRDLLAVRIALSGAGMLGAVAVLLWWVPTLPADVQPTVRWLAVATLLTAGGPFLEKLLKFKDDLTKEMSGP